MMKTKSSKQPCITAATVLAATLLLSPAVVPSGRAAVIDWSASATSSTWGSDSNWSGGTAPANDLTTDIARFNLATYGFSPNAGGKSIAGLIFGDGTTATGALTIASYAAPNQLTIGSSGVVMNALAGAATLGGPLKLGASQTWTNNSTNLLKANSTITNAGNVTPFTLTLTGSGNFEFAGIISDGGTTGTTALEINKAGGSVLLTGANTFTGGLTIKAGSAEAKASPLAFGKGTITLGDSSGSAAVTLINSMSGSIQGPIANAIHVAAGSSGTVMIASNVGNAQYTGAITLDNNLTLGASGGGTLVIKGGISGDGNLTLGNSGAPGANGNITIDTKSVDITGTITNSTTTNGSGINNTISGGIGSGVTTITQESGSVALNISTNALNVNSGGTTLIVTDTAGKQLNLSGGTAGTGDLILKNNSSTLTSVIASGGGVALTGGSINHSGAIINSGTGGVSSGSYVGIGNTATIGSNVTGLIQNSATSSFQVNALVNANSVGTTLANNGGAALNMTGGSAGTGNLVFKNNTAVLNGINVQTGSLNHTGLITNSGLGTGTVRIASVIGTNVTGLIQNSATSVLALEVANTFTGETDIQAGTVDLGTGKALQYSTVNIGASVTQALNFRSTYSTYYFGGLKGTGNLLVRDGNLINVGANNEDTVYSGVLSGNQAKLEKVGTGTLTLSGSNTYTGNTTVSAGTLLINTQAEAGASGTGTGSVAVNSGGTLGGTGILRPSGANTISVAGGGILSPGDSAGGNGLGTLVLDGGGTTGSILTMAAGAKFSFQLGANLESDNISFWNYAPSTFTFEDLVLNGNDIEISLQDGATVGTYTLFNFYSGSGSGLADYGFGEDGLNLVFLDEGISGTLNFDAGAITLTLDAIPEPSTWALLMVSLLGVASFRAYSRRGDLKRVA